MEHTVKINMNHLIGKTIECESIYGHVLKGTIEAVIPANTKPTIQQMNEMYGEDWEYKKCRNAFCKIPWDRVMFENIENGHHIVQPLNPLMKYVKWRILDC